MSEKSRSVLKSYFVPNAIPDSGNFADLIDSFLDKADDGISVSSLNNIGIGDPNPATNLSLKAHYSALSGSLSAAANSTGVTGVGTRFTTELSVGASFTMAGNACVVASIISDTSLVLRDPVPTAIGSAGAQVLRDTLSVLDLQGNPTLYIDKTGRIGFRKTPTATFDVAGAVTADSFVGDGASLSNLQAANLVGVLKKDQIPDIDVSNVSGRLEITADFSRSIDGLASAAAGSSQLTGSGTQFETDFAPGDPLKIGDTVYTIDTIASATALTTREPFATAFANQPIFGQSDLLLAQSAGDALYMQLDSRGNLGLGKSPTAKLDVDGVAKASAFVGDGSGLTALSAASLVGVVSAANLPPISANAVTGELTVTQALDRALAGTVSGDAGSATLTGAGTDFVTDLAAGQQLRVGEAILTARSIESATSLTLSAPLASSVASQAAYVASGYIALKSASGADALVVGPSGDAAFGGAVSAARFSGDGSGLTALSAASLVGQVPAGSIGSVDAAQIQGTLPVGALPPIPASSLTGALSADQLPDIPAAKITGAFPAASLPEIPAAKISGSLAPAQIPALPAGQVASYVEVAVDAAVLANAAPLSLSWRTSGVDALEIAYRNCGAVAKLVSGADIALSQNGYSLNLYQDTALTFTARANGAVVCQRQVFVSVIQTLGQYALQLKYDGCDATATVSACAGRFGLRALNPANVTSLATALKQAGYSASDAFQSIPEFYRSQGATWDPAQYTPILAAVFGGVDQATINSYASAMAAQGQALKQLLPALAQKFGLTTSSASSVQALAVAVKSTAKFTVSDAFQAIPAYYRSIGQPWGPNSPDQGQILLKVFSS